MRDICKHSGTSPPPLPTASASVYYFCCQLCSPVLSANLVHSSALRKFPLQTSSSILKRWAEDFRQLCIKHVKVKKKRKQQGGCNWFFWVPARCHSNNAPDCCHCWMHLITFILHVFLILCRYTVGFNWSVDVSLCLNASSSRIQGVSMGSLCLLQIQASLSWETCQVNKMQSCFIFLLSSLFIRISGPDRLQ